LITVARSGTSRISLQFSKYHFELQQVFDKMNKKYALYIALLGGIFFGCSQYSSSPLSVGFHNVNAKYNALFQANIKMLEAQKILFEAHKDNYSQPLPILIPIDSNSAGGVNEQLTAIIKKASLVVERHQNSKWLDDAYVLIGQARLLKGDYKNAIETFKFVNTTANSEKARDAALVGLMRCYVEQSEYQTALRVAELLSGSDLNDANTRDFYLTKAYLHQLKEEYETSVAILEEALPYMKKNEQKARVLYAAGQMYEALDKKNEASEMYSAVNYSRPSYDLGFYAKLNNALVLGETDGFERLLKDSKNKDLQDKIYEAMSMAEMRKGNAKDGVKLLQASAKNSQNNKQLPFTYLKLADLYYNKMGNYEMASAYYDSTIVLLPPQDANYKRVVEKQRSLSDYVKQYRIIRTEDSLQRLAKMNPAQLEKVLEKIVLDKMAKEAEDLQKAQDVVNRGLQQQGKLANETFTDANKTNWYFTNPLATAQGKTSFTTTWGTRPLEDNWRRSSKENSFTFTQAPVNQSNANLQGVQNLGANQLSASGVKADVAELKTRIPFSAEALAASRKRKEDASFELGKVYKFKLNEPRNAVITFEKFLTDFPKSTHEPEALYLLTILNEDNPVGKASYQKRLMKDYEDSFFARQLNRTSNEILSTGKESEAQKLYAEAYNYYTANNFTDAQSFVDTGLKQYPNSQIEDKFVFLKTLLIAKTDKVEVYQKALKNFITDYPKSQLLTMAKERLAAVEKK
jgi:tetratricopeptide (TPR) repeat protein